MSDTVIKVENLSKLYRLGEVGTGTLSHDLNRWWAGIRGKEDPFLKVGKVNDRTVKAAKGEHVWAIKDINFEVKQGEVLGIIGKNGAGKSTLLKILSRITAPTTGEIKIKGRVGSLLEVGTGFHPEMTGSENIYMNGTILGMTRREISSKLDDIVDFAGIAKYLDTPVKRFSSGMMVRLGFAVAAFLEPEILIVDEVLAVGDAEFQKRAIGKIQDISREGSRTVLFVSHNMSSIRSICSKALLLNNGIKKIEGEVEDVINEYVTNEIGNEATINLKNNGFELKLFELKNSSKNITHVYSAGSYSIRIKIFGDFSTNIPVVFFWIANSYGDRIMLVSSRLAGVELQSFKRSLLVEFGIESLMLMPGHYNMSLALNYKNGGRVATWENFKSLYVENDPETIQISYPNQENRGYVYSKYNVNYKVDI